VTARERSTFSAIRTACVLLCLALTVGHSGPSQAQTDTYPSRPIRIVVGFAPGAFNDIMVRTLAPKLSERLGQPVVVDNRPGAGGNIAGEVVSRAAPDAYTLLAAPTSTLAINPFIYSKLAYDPRRDFAPVSHIANFTLFLAVPGALPVTSMAELLTWTRNNPGRANYGSVAPSFDLLTTVLNRKTGVNFERIPFKSTAETMSALLTGQVAIAYQDYNSMRAHLPAGKVRPLVTLGSRRSADMPDVPTGAEAGQPDLLFDSLTGVVAPKASPPAAIKRLSDVFQAVLRDPEIVARWKQLGISPVGSSAEEFGQTLASELKRWEAIQKATGIKLD
jgi:tripartite-type tricarboxylate transporter receptor subunit TctC